MPVATAGVFDSYVYLNWMGAGIMGLSYGGLLRWYVFVLRAIWWFMPGWTSLPEIWITSRWVSLILLLILGSWSLMTWSGIERRMARFLFVTFGFAVALSIGLRPGAYSWYLPFAFVGFAAAWRAAEALDRSRIMPALVWTAVSLIATILYPWYFMFAGLWLLMLWGGWVVRLRMWAFPTLLAAGSLSVAFTAMPLARWFLDPARSGLIGAYERSGIVFARVPFFANTVLAFGAWIALLFVVAMALHDRPLARERVVRTAWAWMAILFLWFSTPFTGINLYSDHLIAPTIVLALFSLATVWAVQRDIEPPGDRRRLRVFVRLLPVTIAVFSTMFLVYIVQQPLRLHPYKFDSYAVHALHWLSLAVASWIVVIGLRHDTTRRSNRWAVAALALGSIVTAGWGTASVLSRDVASIPALSARVRAIGWIRSHVGERDTICADPMTAAFYAAHTGRRVLPAEATLSYPVPSEAIIRMFEVIAGAYNVTSSGNLMLYRFYTDHYRTIPCAAASKYSHNTWWDRVLRRLGFDEARRNELIGCRQSVIDANWSRVQAAINRHALEPEAFRTLCPQVIVPDDQQGYWQLPADYHEARIDDQTSVWSRP